MPVEPPTITTQRPDKSANVDMFLFFCANNDADFGVMNASDRTLLYVNHPEPFSDQYLQQITRQKMVLASRNAEIDVSFSDCSTR